MTGVIRRYPFSAVVGQQPLKLALKLAAINPALGGVLVSGPKGSAKSTLSKALADIIECRGYGTLNSDGSAVNQRPNVNPPVVNARPFIHLPLGTTEEMLVGSLDIERVLKDGQAQFRPGILAKADGGILYVDEVNLLPDHLVDQLLDVATSGVNTVERDGISHTHNARFILLGTMNPDEGELRPQLLDRFGLAVDIEQKLSIPERIEVVKRREQYDHDPEQFYQQYQQQEEQLRLAIAHASQRLSEIQCSDAIRLVIAERCDQAQVDGLRADIVWLQAAKANAALRQTEHIEITDVDAVEELVLAHRRLDSASSSSGSGSSGSSSSDTNSTGSNSQNANSSDSDINQSAANPNPANQKPSPYKRPPDSRRQAQSSVANNDQQGSTDAHTSTDRNSELTPDDGNSEDANGADTSAGKGNQNDTGWGEDDWGDLPAPSLQAIQHKPLGHALDSIRQQLKNWIEQNGRQKEKHKPNQPLKEMIGRSGSKSSVLQVPSRRINWFASIVDNMGRWPLSKLSFYHQSADINHIHLVLLDTSASVLKQQMLNAAHNLLHDLSQQAYLKRQRIMILGFGNRQVSTLLPLQRAPKLLDQQWSKLFGGGGTPLEQALDNALQQQKFLLRRLPNVQFNNYLLTDGRVRQLPKNPKLHGRSLVIDMEQGAVKKGRARQLAELFQADYLPINFSEAL